MASTTGRIHYADFMKSKRLQNFVVTLLRRPGASTLEIIEAAKTCNPHTCKSECEAQGFSITCERDPLGRYRYTINTVPDHLSGFVDELMGIRPVQPVSLHNAVQAPLF
jgi:hypothetical protein